MNIILLVVVWVILILLILYLCTLGIFYALGMGHIITAINISLLGKYYGPNIYDYQFFKKKEIKHDISSEIPRHPNIDLCLSESLNSYNRTYNTAGLLITKDDQIVFEKYYGKTNKNSVFNTFSIAKTVLSLLVSIAIDEKKINSLDDNIVNYLPEFKQYKSNKITIEHLLNMTSGYDWKDDYKVFETFTRIYYGKDINNYLFKRKFKHKPGTKFRYSSASIQLLAITLSRAINEPIHEYASNKLWKPLEMTAPAYWYTDNTGFEKAFTGWCCNMRDLTKLGILIKNRGVYKGQQIINSTYLAKMTSAQGNKFSGYDAIWVDYKNKIPRFYLSSGFSGQYIIVIPSENIVITRIGKTQLRDIDVNKRVFFPSDIYLIVNEVEKTLKKQLFFV